jgi:hypothetical protein
MDGWKYENEYRWWHCPAIWIAALVGIGFAFVVHHYTFPKTNPPAVVEVQKGLTAQELKGLEDHIVKAETMLKTGDYDHKQISAETLRVVIQNMKVLAASSGSTTYTWSSIKIHRIRRTKP